MIYTTNAVEALHRNLRKIIKTRGSFPTDEAALKLLYLAIRNAGVHWRRPVEWTAANGPVCHPLRRAFSRNRALMSTIDITSVRPSKVGGHAVDATIQCRKTPTSITEIAYTKFRTVPDRIRDAANNGILHLQEIGAAFVKPVSP